MQVAARLAQRMRHAQRAHGLAQRRGLSRDLGARLEKSDKGLLRATRTWSRVASNFTGSARLETFGCARMLATKTRDVEASDVEQAREVKAEVKEEMEPATLEMAKGVLAGNRVSLSRAITLIESWKESHTLQAQYLLEYVLKDRQEKGIDATSSFRLGICGTPGSGKSSTIERLGTMLVRDKGQRVAVLAVDPSSARSGGSILGDKTRMTELSKLEEAYVRPSPTRGSLGGVAQHTNDVVLLCEAAGFDIVIVESVGLGQSEVLIDEVVDMTVLLAAPAGGDELQGVKKGIMEIADMVVVNKADGDLEKVARHAATDYMHALQLMRRKREAWRPRVKKCSALRNTGIEDVWQVVEKFRKTMTESGDLLLKRQQQNRSWMWNQFNEQLMFRAKHDPELHHLADDLAETLGQGYGTPRHAARTLVSEFLRKNAPAPPSSSSSSTSS